MPLLKHAKKKLRQDKKRTLKNKKVREVYKSLVKKARLSPTEKNLSAAFSSIDKASKHHIIHANKAARLKSSLTKVNGTEKIEKLDKEVKKPVEKKVVKKTVKKTTKKSSK